MHDAHAQPHDQAAQQQSVSTARLSIGHGQAEGGSQYRQQPGSKGDGDAVIQRERQAQGEHAAELHGPDAAAHGERAAAQLQASLERGQVAVMLGKG